MRRLLRWMLLPLPAGLLVVALLVSAGFYGYQRLTNEALVAELQFQPLGKQRYRAALTRADGCRTEEYLIYGDQWRIDARFIKWRYWATLLGLDPLYRLERLEGRYQRVTEQNLRPHRAHDLGEAAALDLLSGLASWGRYNPFFDSSYGSSAYVEIDPEQHYRLYRSQTGLLIRSEPVETLSLAPQALTITISRACGEEVSRWQRWALGLNRWLIDR